MKILISKDILQIYGKKEKKRIKTPMKCFVFKYFKINVLNINKIQDSKFYRFYHTRFTFDLKYYKDWKE